VWLAGTQETKHAFDGGWIRGNEVCMSRARKSVFGGWRHFFCVNGQASGWACFAIAPVWAHFQQSFPSETGLRPLMQPFPQTFRIGGDFPERCNFVNYYIVIYNGTGQLPWSAAAVMRIVLAGPCEGKTLKTGRSGRKSEIGRGCFSRFLAGRCSIMPHDAVPKLTFRRKMKKIKIASGGKKEKYRNPDRPAQHRERQD
jgi:hypothetical protein